MMIMKICWVVFYLILVVFYLVVFQTAQVGVDEMLAELNGKPSEEREKLLIDNARKEGMLMFYAVMNLHNTQKIITKFNKQYPFIKITFSNLKNQTSSTKFLQNIAQTLTKWT